MAVPDWVTASAGYHDPSLGYHAAGQITTVNATGYIDRDPTGQPLGVTRTKTH